MFNYHINIKTSSLVLSNWSKNLTAFVNLKFGNAVHLFRRLVNLGRIGKNPRPFGDPDIQALSQFYHVLVTGITVTSRATIVLEIGK